MTYLTFLSVTGWREGGSARSDPFSKCFTLPGKLSEGRRGSQKEEPPLHTEGFYCISFCPFGRFYLSTKFSDSFLSMFFWLDKYADTRSNSLAWVLRASTSAGEWFSHPTPASQLPAPRAWGVSLPPSPPRRLCFDRFSGAERRILGWKTELHDKTLGESKRNENLL